MVLHDLLDDREAQSGAFHLVGDVRLGKAGAILLREADSVVGDLDQHHAILDGDPDADLSMRVRAAGGGAWRWRRRRSAAGW